jgi:hypothetical protein
LPSGEAISYNRMPDTNIPFTISELWVMVGEYIAFSTTAGGSGMDIWVFETRNNRLEQVTHGAKARYPAWLSVP